MNKIFLFFCIVVYAGSAYADLSSLDIEKKINELIENKAQLEYAKNQTETKIKDLAERIKQKKIILNKRTRALSYIKNYQWGDLLLNSDVSSFERNLKIVNRLNKYDLSLFKEYRNSLVSLEAARQDYVKIENDLTVSIQSLQQNQAQLNEADQAYKAKLINDKQESLLRLKGELTRPLVGEVVLKYGSKPDLKNQYSFASKGLLFKTAANQEIKSIGPGKIIFSDAVDHWRETLIVQHDDNYYSVYAGIQANKNALHSQVATAESIGKTIGNEFYFELRHFNHPINPQNWFKEHP